MYIVSACLLGENVKYNGGNNRNDKVLEFLEGKEFIPICPETAGGLKAPRDPAERIGDRILDKTGRDLTEAFNTGARRCWNKVLEAIRDKTQITGASDDIDQEELMKFIDGAILKARSPSCGSGEIYDGTFKGIRIPGDGVFSELLKSKGIQVMTELDLVDQSDFCMMKDSI